MNNHPVIYRKRAYLSKNYSELLLNNTIDKLCGAFYRTGGDNKLINLYGMLLIYPENTSQHFTRIVSEETTPVKP